MACIRARLQTCRQVGGQAAHFLPRPLPIAVQPRNSLTKNAELATDNSLPATGNWQLATAYFFTSASLVFPNVNSSDSLGTLSTNPLISHPSPVGISRDSDTASHWI